MKLLNINPDKYLYKTMIGTGGIGSGMFFLLNGSHTLGREESRSGRLENRKDYCKLHIISHYVQMLLGTGLSVIPVGSVGVDEVGTRLLFEMNEAGIKTRYVESDPDRPTLFSFCFIYPDNSGGNMTTDDSASSSVSPSSIIKARNEFINYSGKGIALAVPEVPLRTREQLLHLGTEYNFFRVASFTSEEMDEVTGSDILKHVDLLAINLDEASKAVKSNSINEPQIVAELSVKVFCSINPDIRLSITNGKHGSWIWDGSDLSFFPALNLEVVSTAGAGDAFISGVIAGLTAGLTLKEAQQVGTLTGGASVTSPHTINKEINRSMLRNLTVSPGFSFSTKVLKLLED
ncbi:MAG: PfkB family carbohydrate kinase [Ignavibacteriaceae bacterium]